MLCKSSRFGFRTGNVQKSLGGGERDDVAQRVRHVVIKDASVYIRRAFRRHKKSRGFSATDDRKPVFS
jgi:hypothetical protein